MLIFTESARRPIWSINHNVCLLLFVVCHLSETFYWSGTETSSQWGSFLNEASFYYVKVSTKPFFLTKTPILFIFDMLAIFFLPFIWTVGGLSSIHIHFWIKQVYNHVALDHQTYSALAQHTQITWTAQLKYDEQYRVKRWRLGLPYIILLNTYLNN